MNSEQMMMAILDKLDKMDARMERLESKITSMESRMTSMESRMTSMESRVTSMESEMASMKSQMNYMNEKINLLNKKTDDLKTDLKYFQKNVQKDISKLQDAQDTIIAVLQGKGILIAN